MRIAWLLPNLHPGGGSRVAMELGAQMTARGHEFIIYIPSGRCQIPVLPGVQVVECGLAVKSPLTAIPLAMIAMAEKVERVDLLIGSMPPYALLAEKIGRDRHIAAVNYMLGDDLKMFDDHGYIKSSLLLWIYHVIARRSFRIQRVWVNSHWTGVQLLSHSRRKPTAIIPCGFNPRYFYPDPPKSKEMNEPFKLVTVGRRPRAKGLPDLLEALNLLADRLGSFKLQVISQDQLDFSNARFPIGKCSPITDDELADCYRQGDIYVNPSWQEGFGLTPLEAMSCGLPVVTTNCGGVREYARNEVNAVMVPPREPGTLAEAIERLMSDSDLREALRRRALETCAKFQWESIADRFEQQALQTLREFN